METTDGPGLDRVDDLIAAALRFTVTASSLTADSLTIASAADVLRVLARCRLRLVADDGHDAVDALARIAGESIDRTRPDEPRRQPWGPTIAPAGRSS